MTLVALATLAWSLSGVFTRLLSIDVWTAVAWRSFFGGLCLALVHAGLHRRRFWMEFDRLGRPGWTLAAAQVICQACTVGALFLTSVADVTLIYAAAPFLAAALAWGLLHEPLPLRTVGADALVLPHARLLAARGRPVLARYGGR